MMTALGEISPKGRKKLIFLCVSIPSFMINLDANIVSISLPSIARSLGASFTQIEWVISAYTLAFASLVLVAGTLADRFGRKRLLIAGLVIFTISSFVCGAAPTIRWLLFARAMQGLGAAFLMSAALALLSHEFRGEERARAFALWGSIIGVAITIGPPVGGMITQHFGWEWAFYINVPIGIGIIAATAPTITESKNSLAKTLDIPGLATFSLALFLLTLALISGNHSGWTSPSVLAELLAAAVFFVAFIAIERRTAEPMVDLGIFTSRSYVGTIFAGVAYSVCFLTMLTFIPLFLQTVHGAEADAAGLMMLPMAVPMVIVPVVLSRWFGGFWSGRALLTAGLLLVASGILVIGVAANAAMYAPILAGMIVAGTGAGILNGETAKVAMTLISPHRAGMAAGIGGTIRFSGVLIGFAGLGAILFQAVFAMLESAMPASSSSSLISLTQQVVAGDLGSIGADRALVVQSLDTAFRILFLIAAALSFITAIVTWVLVRMTDTPPIAPKSEADPMNSAAAH